MTSAADKLGFVPQPSLRSTAFIHSGHCDRHPIKPRGSRSSRVEAKLQAAMLEHSRARLGQRRAGTVRS
jgi:hypothetical protein